MKSLASIMFALAMSVSNVAWAESNMASLFAPMGVQPDHDIATSDDTIYVESEGQSVIVLYSHGHHFEVEAVTGDHGEPGFRLIPEERYFNPAKDALVTCAKFEDLDSICVAADREATTSRLLSTESIAAGSQAIRIREVVVFFPIGSNFQITTALINESTPAAIMTPPR